MVTTIGNTAKWKIAQGAINGISSAMSDAVKYAKDMNSALNDIRIVTQKSTGEIANFAKDAQLAARELSTTSTEYAKAALIFYQQGLEGDEVLKRADAVVKLANVTN
jgi:TP901 family phage tail tape measure protein